MTGAVVLVEVLTGGVVGTVLAEVVREVLAEVDTDDTDEVLDVETTLEVWVVVVGSRSGGPVASIGLSTWTAVG